MIVAWGKWLRSVRSAGVAITVSPIQLGKNTAIFMMVALTGPEASKRGQTPFVHSTLRAFHAKGVCPLFDSQGV